MTGSSIVGLIIGVAIFFILILMLQSMQFIISPQPIMLHYFIRVLMLSYVLVVASICVIAHLATYITEKIEEWKNRK